MRAATWTALAVLAIATLPASGLSAPACATEIVEIYPSVAGVVVKVPEVGARVREGDDLVFVRTSTNPQAVTARATVDGTVLEVLVKPGDIITLEMVSRRAVLVRICKG
ncbi:MAG: hypothetical protein QN198_04060 [Armatimonadota bacterium]|nr:hypothetical protein [Armatimonadota bacterium]MDR5702757.1 hypothetical protein [Armatimonadota bacterium]MDR7435187.1 hypothetical protein [Armatimonadota bacterium]